MPTFTCSKCEQEFDVPQPALDKYPGWVPKVCLKCKGGGSKKKRKSRKKTRTAEVNLTLEQVLESYTDGPTNGLFTDGSAQPNPGPGGWGAVFVRDGQVVAQNYGHEAQTTNNRMELTALIEGARLVPEGTKTTVYTDSDLCVKSLTQWAIGWKKNGWRRKSGAIKNLELVQEAFALFQERTDLSLKWIQAHEGSRWNEYADALSTAWARDEL